MKVFFYQLNQSHYNIGDIITLDEGTTLHINENDCINAMKSSHRQRRYTHEVHPNQETYNKGVVFTVSLVGDGQDAIKMNQPVKLQKPMIAEIENIKTHPLSMRRFQTPAMFMQGNSSFSELVNACSSLGALKEDDADLEGFNEDDADSGFGLKTRFSS